MMADDPKRTAAEEDGEKDILFDAVLVPHRSLSPRGFLILMAVICLFAFAAGFGFFLAGAWPIVGFLGLDVLLIYIAFRTNYRHARMSETLTLSKSALVVERTDHWGQSESWRFQPYWLQVLIDDPPRGNGKLTLRSHGKQLTIGSFLTPEERLEVAQELRAALFRCRAHGAPASP
jgi:uncharacterized membrane protein